MTYTLERLINEIRTAREMAKPDFVTLENKLNSLAYILTEMQKAGFEIVNLNQGLRDMIDKIPTMCPECMSPLTIEKSESSLIAVCKDCGYSASIC